MTGLTDTLGQLEAAYEKVRQSLRGIPTRDLAKLHDDSAEGRRLLPPEVMDAACALLRERIQYCGCDENEEAEALPTHEAALATTVERLEAAYAAAHGRLVAESMPARFGGDRPAYVDYRPAPEEMRDTSGRFILLDALTALVQARTVLAQIGGPS